MSSVRDVSRRDFLQVASAAALATSTPNLGAQQVDHSVASLLIRNGTIATCSGRSAGDVRVIDGVIAEIGRGLKPGPKESVIDATSLLVLPGGIDPHVHIPQAADTWTTGSAAALAGGITTVGNMTWDVDNSIEKGIAQARQLVATQAMVDVVLHAGVPDELTDGDLPAFKRLLESGIKSVKFFTLSLSFDARIDQHLALFRMANAAGALCLFHTEDRAILGDATSRLLAAGHSSAQYHAASRPLIGEEIAVARITAWGEHTGAPVYIVHLSSRRALDVCTNARSRGTRVYVETRPVYLHLTRERYAGPDAALYVCWPPLRETDDVDAMWQGLQQGMIHTLGSDHLAWTRAEKMDPNLKLPDFPPGSSNLDVMLPMLFSEGVVKGRLLLERFVSVTSTNPAKLFGLYPAKGEIAIGSDADLALWDPTASRTVRAADLKTRADYCLYEGWEVTGWPRTVLRRGVVAFDRGSVVSRPGSGRVLQPGATQPL